MSDNTFRVLLLGLLTGMFVGIVNIRMNLDDLVRMAGG